MLSQWQVAILCRSSKHRQSIVISFDIFFKDCRCNSWIKVWKNKQCIIFILLFVIKRRIAILNYLYDECQCRFEISNKTYFYITSKQILQRNCWTGNLYLCSRLLDINNLLNDIAWRASQYLSRLRCQRTLQKEQGAVESIMSAFKYQWHWVI